MAEAFGALYPKKILSWFNPPPYDAPLRYPRQIPKVVVPSFIGDEGQVLNLLMHHGTGNIVRDYSGFHNDGRLYGGVSWVDGSWGWALSFDGVDDWAESSVPQVQGELSALSMEVWVKTSKTDYYHIISRGTAWKPGNVILCIEVDSHFTFTIYGYYFKADSDVTPDGRWHHLVGVFDGSKPLTERMAIYVDGLLKAYGGYNYLTVPALAEPIRIATRTASDTDFLQSDIAAVRIYNRALRAEEIKYHYESTKALFT